jgi:hypothetical protein
MKMKIFLQKETKRTKEIGDTCSSCFRTSFPLFPSVKILYVIFAFLSIISVKGEQVPAVISASSKQAWVGQRLPFFIELHTRGSFDGSPTFSIPQIPGTVILKVGNPIVSSRQIDGEDWFTQRHEFALFSQRDGTLEIPAFPIRFSSRDGFTSPVTEVDVKSEALTLTIQRPPGSEDIGFLITTDSLEITETWNPEPGSAEVGSVFKRTITQRAAEMTGMALAPAPTRAPEGTRLYPGRAEVTDKTERGDFLGERRETIIYLIEKPGTITLPEITFNWWNPATKTIASKTLPAVTFDVPAPPAVAASSRSTKTLLWPWLLAIALIAIAAWQRKNLAAISLQARKALNPPHRVAARKLLHACRANDPTQASAAWSAWRDTRPAEYQPPPDLQLAVLAMQRHRFGPAPASPWQGENLARAFRKQTIASSTIKHELSSLPPLNP